MLICAVAATTTRTRVTHITKTAATMMAISKVTKTSTTMTNTTTKLLLLQASNLNMAKVAMRKFTVPSFLDVVAEMLAGRKASAAAMIPRKTLRHSVTSP